MDRKPIYVVGHKNPDTDSIVAAIAYAHFLRERTGKSNIFAARAGSLNDETKFVLKYFHEKQPILLKNLRNKNVIIVDHNEVNLALPGVKQANILEIIDHHRIGGMETIHPIDFVNEPRGCTSAIIAERYFKFNIPLSSKMAGLLLSAMISDTILLHSPMTTHADRVLARKLSRISGINIKKYGMQLLKSGCDLIEHSPEKIIKTDLKIYTINKRSAGIGQVNVADSKIALHKRRAILEEMENIRKKMKLDYLFLMITNIITLRTDLLFTGIRTALVSRVFKKPVNENMIVLPNTVSRKKQVQPFVLRILETS